MVARARRRFSNGPPTVAGVLTRLEKEVDRSPARSEWVPVRSALGRIPSEAIRARRVLPPRDQSTMDGFAVRSPRFSRAGTGKAPTLRVVGRSSPGEDGRRIPHVDAGTAVEILTGAPLPPGADAILRLEDCSRSGSMIRPRRPVIAGRDVARRGEDFRPGRTIIEAGAPLRPWHIAALMVNEVSRVRAFRRLRVGVLSTGGELVGMGKSLRSGRVRDTTRPLILGLLAELGVTSVDLGLVPDRAASIRRAVRRGLASCDIVITTGGSSVGKSDLVPEVIRSLGNARWIATRLRLRPGSTTRVAIVGGRPVFLLSGPPVAAFSGFVSLVEPFLRDREGDAAPAARIVSAVLARTISHSPGVREMVRVRLESRKGVTRAIEVERHGATRLSSLTQANGFLILEEHRGDYPAGEAVNVSRL